MSRTTPWMINWQPRCDARYRHIKTQTLLSAFIWDWKWGRGPSTIVWHRDNNTHLYNLAFLMPYSQSHAYMYLYWTINAWAFDMCVKSTFATGKNKLLSEAIAASAESGPGSGLGYDAMWCQCYYMNNILPPKYSFLFILSPLALSLARLISKLVASP